jgi:HK97 family phage portal protein
MGFMQNLFGSAVKTSARPAAAVPFVRGESGIAADTIKAMSGSIASIEDFGDPVLKKFLDDSGLTESGAQVTVKKAMRNTTVFRCVSLISYSMGMLPLHLIDVETKQKIRDHPLFRLLHRQPNDWQTAFDFRSLLQYRALVYGDAYALIVRSGTRPIRLIPLDPGRVEVRQGDDWKLTYQVTLPSGRRRSFPASEIFHLRGMSEDGIHGTSLVKVAAEAIGLAIQTERAAARLFRNGMLVGGALSHQAKLSPDAYERLKTSMEERLTGAENAGKWMILEEGMSANPFAQTGKDNQHLEMRKHQVEEISRPFGVPRPLLNLDETNWGSGIDVLGQFFVRYGLNPWFEAWEQAIYLSLLTEEEKGRIEAKYNAGALLRGSLKDQGEYFARALGAGGHQPWMDYEEVRDTMDLPEKEIAPNPMAQTRENGNVPSQSA